MQAITKTREYSRRAISSAALLMVFLLIPLSSINAQPSLNIKYEYYDIDGKTAGDLRQQMNGHGIKWEDGKTYDALTNWFVRWNFKYEIKNARCAITSVNTDVDISYKLPRWKNPSGTGDDLVKKWDRYLDALKEHEDGHKDFGVNAANEIQAAIANMSSYDNCENLKEEANALGRRIVEKYQKKEKEYDLQTEHGKSQGAIFP